MHTILVVEDESEIQELVKEILEEHGYKVVQAKTRDEAWKAFKSNSSLNVIFMDRKLGQNITTDSLIVDIKRSDPFIIIVAFSGDEDSREQQIKLGCSYGVSKSNRNEIIGLLDFILLQK